MKEVKTVKTFWRALCMSVVVAGMVALAGSAFAATFSVKGKVTDTKGVAIEDIGVLVIPISSGGTPPMMFINTDATGAYEVHNLDNGTYVVGFQDNSFDRYMKRAIYVSEYYDNLKANDSNNAKRIVLVKDNATNINAQLALGGTISGTVTDKNGAPVENVEVVAYSASTGNLVYYEYTIDNGTYVVFGLPQDTYKVYFWPGSAIGNFAAEFYNNTSFWEDADSLILATEGQALKNIDAKLETAGSISGKVTVGDNATVANIEVYMCAPDGSSCDYVWTMPDGTYAFNNVRPDKYKMAFLPGEAAPDYAAEWYNDQITFLTADNLTVVQDNTTKNINAKLEKSGAITGSVKNFFRRPIPGAEVFVYDANAPFYTLWDSYIDRTYVDEDGNFALAGLKPGDYKLFFYAETETGTPYANEWWRNKGSFKRAKEITVTAGETSDGIKAILTRWMRLF